MPVQFYANSVELLPWLWDFGDSTTSSLENPFHIYQTNGNYNVTLTIFKRTVYIILAIRLRLILVFRIQHL